MNEKDTKAEGQTKKKKDIYVRLKRAAIFGDPVSGIELNRWINPVAKVPEGADMSTINLAVRMDRIEFVSEEEAKATRPAQKPPRFKMTRDRAGLEPEGEMANDPAYLMLQENREPIILTEIRKATDLDFLERAINYETMGANLGLQARVNVIDALWNRINELRRKSGLDVTREKPEILPIA